MPSSKWLPIAPEATSFPAVTARTNKTVLAVVLAVAVIAAACADDPIDEEPTFSEPPETTEAPAEEPQRDDAADESDETAGEEPDEPDDAAPADPPTEPADLGAFNDYEPDEPDPTLLDIDPEVQIGTLDNGLTYYLRSNDSPAGQVSMRLVVNAGAVLDPPGQEGIAHFLEQMLFNGTEKFSKLELRQALRDLGIEFGPDLNAYTSADETVYLLDFQLDDPEALDLAFTVFSEWASAATLDPAEVEAERGIVLDEHRLTDQSANGWISNFLDAIYYSGTVYEGMLIGGSEESNSSITTEQLRDFYETWYRPDNMALVVVGDLPVAEMAQKAEQFFGGLTNPADPMPAQPERNAFTADFVDEPVIDIATHPDYGFISMSVDWQLPAWAPTTVGGDRFSWMEAVIGFALDVRLANAHRAGLMTQTDEPDMVLWQQARGLRLYGTNIEGPDLAQATTDYLSVLAGAAHYGFSDEELEQATTLARTFLNAELEGEATIRSAGYADRYVSNFVDGASVESVEDRVARLEALLDTFTTEELTAHLRWILDNAPPLVVPLGDDPANVPDIAQLRAAIDAVVPVPPPPPEERIEILLATPDPVAPIREHPVGLFEGAYEWVFANGAHVVFAPSDLAAGHVDVSASSLGGWSQLPMGSAAMRRAITGAVANSGVADYSASQLDEYLAGTTARVTPFITELTEGFTGYAGPDDLDDLLALMQLYITEPRVSEVSAAEQIQNLRIRRTSYENNPQWTAVFDLYDATYQNSPWYHFILTHEEIDELTADGLLDLYEARLNDVDDLLVVIVGDIDQATVADLAARYIGTLPAGEADAHVNHNPGFPPGISRITTPVGADSGAAGLYLRFGAALPVTAETLVIADLVNTLLDDLLVGSVRDDLGETYSVGVELSPLIEVGLWDVYFSASGPSESLELINSTIVETVAELIANGPSTDDLTQAKSVLRDDYRLDDNGEITGPLLMRRHLDDALVGTPDQRLALLEELTAEDISRYAALFFNLDNRIEAFRSVQ